MVTFNSLKWALVQKRLRNTVVMFLYIKCESVLNMIKQEYWLEVLKTVTFHVSLYSKLSLEYELDVG